MRYRFGRCELNTATRELRVDGALRDLEPLPFDVLAYLLRHRERVVSTDELLDEVWLGRIVSIGSVARAIRAVRRAIAEGAPAEAIRTAHRVGYHFAGQVLEVADPPPAGLFETGDTVAVALLPFENRTGDFRLDWSAMGLMALVGCALSMNRRLAPMTVHEVSATMRALPDDASLDERVGALLEGRPLLHVVHTCIQAQSPGLRLDFRLLSGPRQGTEGSVFADGPVRLGRALTRRLQPHLLQGAEHEADLFTRHDPWAMQLFARAIHAQSRQEFGLASTMLRVVLDLEPDFAPAAAELALLQAQRSRRSP